MKLSTLSNDYGDFYAPSYTIKIGGVDLVRDLAVPISQLEVDLQLGTASRFSFTIPNCYNLDRHFFEAGNGQDLLTILTFGGDIEVFMGYGDLRTTPASAKGLITEISTNFPESGSPELSISGYDHGFPLNNGRKSRTWTKQRDSDAVREIASYNNLNSAIETTKEEHPQIEQNQESDWQFLQKLAKRNHFELYVDEQKRLHFAPPNDKANAVLELVYGSGLLSFKPQANLAGQVSKVEVYGWDRKAKKEIIGTAEAGQESGLNGTSPGQFLNSFGADPKKMPVLRIRQPVFTQSEANQRAKAALNDKAKKFLTGEAESIGLPELRPDRNVALKNLGTMFSKTYYIEQATHKVDSGGYRTRFKVKEPGL